MTSLGREMWHVLRKVETQICGGLKLLSPEIKKLWKAISFDGLDNT